MKYIVPFLIALSIAAFAGCDISVERSLIPTEELGDQQEQAIREAIAKNDRDTLRRIGKPAAPMILERVFEIYNSRPRRQDPIWADAANLVLLLGDIKDKRSVPALNHLITNLKYRVFRGNAAYALGKIRDKRSVEPLWMAFNQEMDYYKKGDRKGPDYGWGVAGNYTVQMLRYIGTALERLGENPGDYPRTMFDGW